MHVHIKSWNRLVVHVPNKKSELHFNISYKNTTVWNNLNCQIDRSTKGTKPIKTGLRRVQERNKTPKLVLKRYKSTHTITLSLLHGVVSMWTNWQWTTLRQHLWQAGAKILIICSMNILTNNFQEGDTAPRSNSVLNYAKYPKTLSTWLKIDHQQWQGATFTTLHKFSK